MSPLAEIVMIYVVKMEGIILSKYFDLLRILLPIHTTATIFATVSFTANNFHNGSLRKIVPVSVIMCKVFYTDPITPKYLVSWLDILLY